MRNDKSWMTALGGVLALGAATSHAADVSIGTGANYSSGTYGTPTTTDIWSAPLSVAYKTERWTFAASVPYVRVHGSGNVIPGTGPVDNTNPLGRGLADLLGSQPAPAAGKPAGATTASGLGDVVASASYGLLSGADHGVSLNLTGKVKFGTADVDKGLGTGRNDYGLALDTSKALGKWTPFGGVGWTRYGSSRYIKLRDAVNANTGVDYRLNPSDNAGVYYAYRQPISSGGASQSEVTAYWNHQLTGRVRVQTYALGGLSNGSPDWGAGTALTYTF
jgi:hypothetical protein